MGSSNEMFERGVHDAEQDDLNPFYYQHYYYYRKGYDKARRRLRREPIVSGLALPGARNRLLGALLAVGLLALAGFFVWGRMGRAPLLNPTGARSASPIVRPSSPASPTRIPRTPTPEMPTATALPALRPQVVVTIVNLNGNPLRLRAGAGTTQRVVARLPEGSEVTLIEGPVEADGYTWWRVESERGSGWLAERSQEGVVWLQPK
jgi:hypothetical protein